MRTIIDISYYQDPNKIDYDQLAAQVDGVIIRSSYGTGAKEWKGKPDTAFNRHYQELTKRNVPVGCYHYLVEYETVDAQLAIVKLALDGKDFPLGIWNDVELESGAPALTRKTVIEYMTKAEAIFGELGVYTGAWCWNPIMGTSNPYSSRRLWVASYSTSPYIPIGWKDYWMWQYTSSGRLNGYAGNLDMNRCSEDTWRIWMGYTIEEEYKLEVPAFSQKDARWAADKLGTSNVTIGGYGCLITAASSVCNYFGKNTNPGQINKDLIKVNGYSSGNLLIFNAISTIYPDIVVDWGKFLSDPDNKTIDQCLANKIPVIVQVDYNPATSVLDQHWVVITGKDASGYVIMDPIDGGIAYLSRYAGKAFRMVVYQKQVAEEELFKAKVITDALNVRSEPVYYKDGRNIVDLLKKDDVVNVYQIADNGWFRIGVGKWCSGDPQYIERIQITPPPPPPPPVLTLEERVTQLEKNVEALNQVVFR